MIIIHILSAEGTPSPANSGTMFGYGYSSLIREVVIGTDAVLNRALE